MVAKEDKKKNNCDCGDNCTCNQNNNIVIGYKYGLGFWLAGLTVWIIVSILVAALYYFL